MKVESAAAWVRANRRFLAPVAAAAITVGSMVYLLFTPGNSTLIDIAAVGPPISVFLVVRALVRPDPEDRRPWITVVIGATAVPFLVIMLGDQVFAISAVIFGPIVDALRSALDSIAADPALLGDALGDWWVLYWITGLAVAAPLGEETLKAVGALVRRPRTAKEAFLFGCAAGAGFAVIENLLYVTDWFYSDGWLPIAVMRTAGSGLHLLGAGLTALAFFQWRHGDRGFGHFLRWYGAAMGIHALWNGSIALTLILFDDRFALGLAGDAEAWGIGLEVLLGAYGALILAVLLGIAHRLGQGRVPLTVLGTLRIDRPARVGAWAMVTSAILVPATILILAFPSWVAL